MTLFILLVCLAFNLFLAITPIAYNNSLLYNSSVTEARVPLPVQMCEIIETWGSFTKQADNCKCATWFYLDIKQCSTIY